VRVIIINKKAPVNSSGYQQSAQSSRSPVSM